MLCTAFESNGHTFRDDEARLIHQDFQAYLPVIFRPDASPLGWSVTVYGQETKEGLAMRLVTAALEKGLIPRGPVMPVDVP